MRSVQTALRHSLAWLSTSTALAAGLGFLGPACGGSSGQSAVDNPAAGGATSAGGSAGVGATGGARGAGGDGPAAGGVGGAAGGLAADSGTGTDALTGGGTCTLASTCLGLFFGSCFDAPASCTTDKKTGATCYQGGGSFQTAGDVTTALSSGGVACFSFTRAGAVTTFSRDNATLVYSDDGNQVRVTCTDGSMINFTSSAFSQSDCASVLPTGKCMPGKC